MPGEKKDRIKISPVKGRPMLNWLGKKPLDYVKGFPAQLVEVFDPFKTGRIVETPTYNELKNNWQNLLFHGDNKDVLATLLELGFRGKIDLIYIDPPFQSGADYMRKVELRGIKNLERIDDEQASLLQQTMYYDIWNNDTYLEFMYERLLLLKELLNNDGSIYVHLDLHVVHYIKLIMDEIFPGGFRNEIVWFKGREGSGLSNLPTEYQNILLYKKSKGSVPIWNPPRRGYSLSTVSNIQNDEQGWFYTRGRGTDPRGALKTYVWDDPNTPKEEVLKIITNPNYEGSLIGDMWADIPNRQITGFSTEKPEALLERIISASSRPDSLVLDCFIGSGTTARVAQKLGRRWIGCDINKGAIYLTSRELQKIINEQVDNNTTQYPSFAIYKVNDYDLKILRTEAIELAVQHIGIQRTKTDIFFDGTFGKSLVKIIDFNHPLSLLDLQLIQDELKKRPEEDRDITIVCLGKELAVDPWIEDWNRKHSINKITIIELKTDSKYGNFLIHKPDEAKVSIKRKKNKALIEIKEFISPTIIERLNIEQKLFKLKIPDFRSMIDCVLVDTNYDGKIFHSVYSDVPEKKNDLVQAKYEIDIPAEKTRIAVKIVDMLGEEVIVDKEI